MCHVSGEASPWWANVCRCGAHTEHSPLVAQRPVPLRDRMNLAVRNLRPGPAMRPSDADVSGLWRTSCLVALSDQCEKARVCPQRETVIGGAAHFPTAPDLPKLPSPFELSMSSVTSCRSSERAASSHWWGLGMGNDVGSMHGWGIARLHRDVSSSRRK